MKVSDLQERLCRFGLRESEAIAYFHLSQMGASRAADVARATGLNRPDVYRTMDALEERGFVERTLERPTKFVPVPLDEALSHALNLRQEEMQELKKEKQALGEAWPRVEDRSGAQQDRISMHQGSVQVHSLRDRLLESAEESLTLVAAGAPGEHILPPQVMRRLRQKAEAGVRVRVLAEPTQAAADVLSGLTDVCQVRHSRLPTGYGMVLADATQAALITSRGSRNTARTDLRAIWFDSPGFVQAQKHTIDALWSHAMSHEALYSALQRGEAAPMMRLVRGRWVRLQLVESLAEGAKESILLRCPASELARLEEAGVLEILERRARQGIQIHLQSGEGTTAAGAAYQVLETDPHALWMVVDGTQTLAACGLESDPGSMTAEDEWGVHCGLPAMAQDVLADHHLQTMLDGRRSSGSDEQVLMRPTGT